MRKGIVVALITASVLMAVLSDGAAAVVSVIQSQEVSYTQIEVEEVPGLVNDALKEYFTDYVTNKAYRGDDGSYKLEVSKEDIQYILYYKENGELIKVEQPETNANE